MADSQFSGLILVDKPKDITSFSVISRLRVLTGIKKIGHCGTLDPFATGLLPVVFGRYTRLAKYIEGQTKHYFVRFVLGKATDTQDLTGKVIAEVDNKTLTARILSGELEKSLNDSLEQNFLGEIEQTPPMYSAIKIKGKPLYKYARAGQEVERKKRQVFIYSAKLGPLVKINDEWEIEAKIHCSKGTYIRTLVDDLAKSVKCLAYTKELRRVQIGNLNINHNPVDLDELFDLFNSNNRDKSLIKNILTEQFFYPIEQAMQDFPFYVLNSKQLIDVSYGRKILLDPVQIETRYSHAKTNLESDIIRLNYQNEIIALAKINPQTLEFEGYEKVLYTNQDLKNLFND
ncbi:MAG: tRNA pseudouridine(55) synthase TruB [Clostridiaceae bacterium]|nr:tRNA pseudouridine(55) synthase TruB [Clostridiaceae bacterium]